MLPRSSTIARARRSTLRPGEVLREARSRTPRANAMSVGIAIPHPRSADEPAVRAMYARAGTSMPPTAATSGRMAARRSLSSPAISSRLISSPTTRKKKVMRPSRIPPRRSSETLHRLRRNTSSVPQSCSYVSRHGEFAHAIAMATAPTIRIPEAVSASRNDWSGRITRRGTGRSDWAQGMRRPPPLPPLRVADIRPPGPSKQPNPDHPGEERGREDPDLSRVSQPIVRAGQLRDEQRHGETDAGNRGGAQKIPPPHAPGQRSDPGSDRDEARSRDARQLAHNQPGD